MALHFMSDKELSRLEILRDLVGGRLTTPAAAQLLGLERRQVQRLAKAYQEQGATALISKQRGRPSNRRKPDNVRATALAIIGQRYADFGPTLAAEKLRELHGISLGRETVRAWMIAAGFWEERKKRRRRIHQPRYRRDCVGELIQIDGSEHRWFEDRGPMCTLLVYIDDATSRLMHLRFVETESTFAYFAATQGYLEAHGKPVAFYSDKHSVFRVAKAGVTGDGMTQFGRALHALNIEIICANTSQAKGRVERANKTLQDRLVKEMRLAGVNTLEAGNAFLPGFVADYNARFAKPPANAKDLHRPMAPARPAGRRLQLAGRADAVAVADPAIRQGAVHPGPDRGGPGGDRQAGHGRRLSRRAPSDQLPRNTPLLPDLRQDPEGQPGRRRREQAPGPPAGNDQALPGRPAAARAQPQGPQAARPERTYVQRRLTRSKSSEPPCPDGRSLLSVNRSAHPTLQRESLRKARSVCQVLGAEP
jgi:transposase